MFPILSNISLNKNNEPYKVFTPFKNNLLEHEVDKVNMYKKFVFKKFNILKTSKYYFDDYNSLYTKNNNIIAEGFIKVLLDMSVDWIVVLTSIIYYLLFLYKSR